LEYDVGSSLDQLSAAFEPRHRRISRLVPEQQLPALEYSLPVALPGAFRYGRRKDLTFGKAGEVARSGRPHEGVHVVDDGALVDAEFRGLHPRVAIEVFGHDQKRIRDDSALRNLKPGHLDYKVGLAQLPTALPCGRRVFRDRIALGRSAVHPLRD